MGAKILFFRSDLVFLGNLLAFVHAEDHDHSLEHVDHGNVESE